LAACDSSFAAAVVEMSQRYLAHNWVVAVRASNAAAMTARRFPPPWSVDELEVCFVVRDHDGQQLAYIYFESEAGRRSAAKLLTRDEARRIASNIAKLPELLGKGD
jgi:hypothetical protein